MVDAKKTPGAGTSNGASERFQSLVKSYEERDTPKRWRHY